MAKGHTEQDAFKHISFQSGKDDANSGRPKAKDLIKEGYYHKKSYEQGYKEHQKPEWGG